MRSHVRIPRSHELGWQALAKCVGHDPEIWFTPSEAKEAIGICRGCPVRIPCARIRRGSAGVWGGKAHYPNRAQEREATSQCTCTRCGTQWRVSTLWPHLHRVITRLCPDCIPKVYPEVLP